MISTSTVRPPHTAVNKTSAAEIPMLERVSDSLSDSWNHLRIAVDAQVNIWTMKLSRAIFVAALAIPALGAMLALMIYGFVLLNQAFALALETGDMPPWYSPLIRGVIYFGIPSFTMAVVWWNSAGGTAHSQALKK
jgi:hypothetical protein